jgi:hypothetical protein
MLPARVRQVARRTLLWPPRGTVRFGSLRRLTPVGGYGWGSRGTPVDRYYIGDFLRRHSGIPGYMQGDIRGRVLEIGDDSYSREFGGWGDPSRETRVTRVDVLHVDKGHPNVTVVADLASADQIPSETYDCIICTQTLLLIYEVRAAIGHLNRIVKPGGVVLATVPGVSRLCRPEADLWGDYWRFTSLSARRLFAEAFGERNVTVEAYGNVLAAVAFLHGIAAEELRREELDLRDPSYEVLIAVRAIKA